MFNLFVTSDEKAWNSDSITFDLSRCIREYTDNHLKEKYAALDTAAIDELRRLPCLFAYESSHKINPKFGVIRDVHSRNASVRVDYEVISIDPFITCNDLEQFAFELDIGRWELNRTHWAVKDIRLDAVLRKVNVSLPFWARFTTKAVNISSRSC